MKRYLILLTLVSFFTGLAAQNTNGKINTRYLRPSITMLFAEPKDADEAILINVSIPNPPLYRLKKNGLGVTSLSKSVLSLFDLVLWEQFFPVYWSLQGRYFFECGSQPCVRIHTGLQAASQQRIKYAVVLCTAVIA